MKKRLFVISAVFIFISSLSFLLIYIIKNGNPYTMLLVQYHMKKHMEGNDITEDMLVPDKSGYIEPKQVVHKDYYRGLFQLRFKDEPQITYYYGLHKENKAIIQFCKENPLVVRSFKKAKHSEEVCANAYNN
ncbi:DUF3139 domain-containing protein [Viridibacillus arvi]|uniref:DUF3139 domain-containing protein n=2 Tax=Viridibacillus arvi TaxID=263475 RepID=UPI0036BAA922